MSETRAKNYMNVTIEMQNKKIKELEQQVEDMKCCGNCKNSGAEVYVICKKSGLMKNGFDCCKNWKFDELPQKERMW